MEILPHLVLQLELVQYCQIYRTWFCRIPGSSSWTHEKTKIHSVRLDLDNARNWGVFHEDVITADTKAFILNSTSAVFLLSGTACWDVSAIDATTFTPYFRDDFLVQVIC